MFFVCPRTETEGCFSLECEGVESQFWGMHLHNFSSRKSLSLLIKIIELCVNDHPRPCPDREVVFRPVSVELWLSDKNQVKSCFKLHSRYELCSPPIYPSFKSLLR